MPPARIGQGRSFASAFRHQAGLRLDGARLDGARLDGARLDGARLDGARLGGARRAEAAEHLVAPLPGKPGMPNLPK